MEHENIDPMTGGCFDCGARYEEIADGLAPNCRKVSGPYRQAIIVLRRERVRTKYLADRARGAQMQAEAAVVSLQRQSRELDAQGQEIEAALIFLGDVVVR